MPANRHPAPPGRDALLPWVILAAWALFTIWQQWGAWAQDLSAVYIGGWLWQNGQPALIYATPEAFFGGSAASWQPIMQSLGVGDQISFAYIYPPIWAAIVAPLTSILGPQGFLNLALLLQIPLLAASVLLAGRIIRPAAMPPWLWALAGVGTLTFSIQSVHAIWQGQPTITVGFLILLAFERLGAGRPVAAGAALALAAAIKLTPALFVLVLLLDRQHRAVAGFAAVGAGLALASVLLTGWPLHLAFLESLARASQAVMLNPINVSLTPALLALGAALELLPAIDPAAQTTLLTQPPVWVTAVGTGAGLVLLGLALRRISGHARRQRRALGLLAVSVGLALFGPLGWLHYYVLPLLLLPGLIGVFSPRLVAMLLVLVGVPSLAPVFAQIGHLPWPAANYVWIMCLAWLAVLAALAFAPRRDTGASALARPPL